MDFSLINLDRVVVDIVRKILNKSKRINGYLVESSQFVRIGSG